MWRIKELCFVNLVKKKKRIKVFEISYKSLFIVLFNDNFAMKFNFYVNQNLLKIYYVHNFGRSDNNSIKLM